MKGGKSEGDSFDVGDSDDDRASGRRACGVLEPELLSSHALNLTKKIFLPTPPHDSYQSRTEC